MYAKYPNGLRAQNYRTSARVDGFCPKSYIAIKSVKEGLFYEYSQFKICI